MFSFSNPMNIKLLSQADIESATLQYLHKHYDFSPKIHQIQLNGFNVGTFRSFLPVGDSGAGKTTTAYHCFDGLQEHKVHFPAKKCIFDAFLSMGKTADEVSTILTSVGLGSVPQWCRRYSELSGGEKFRTDLAAAMLSGKKRLFIDEFTSNVDRDTAFSLTKSVTKLVQRDESYPSIVAASVHRDVIDFGTWDYVYDITTQRFVIPVKKNGNTKSRRLDTKSGKRSLLITTCLTI
jgi:ABC-type lipoprotein export system ATPase subunit